MQHCGGASIAEESHSAPTPEDPAPYNHWKANNQFVVFIERPSVAPEGKATYFLHDCVITNTGTKEEFLATIDTLLQALRVPSADTQ